MSIKTKTYEIILENMWSDIQNQQDFLSNCQGGLHTLNIFLAGL